MMRAFRCQPTTMSFIKNETIRRWPNANTENEMLKIHCTRPSKRWNLQKMFALCPVIMMIGDGSGLAVCTVYEHFRSRHRGRWSTHECKKEEWRCERGMRWSWARVMGCQYLVFIFPNGSEHRCRCHNRSIFVNRCLRVFIFKFVPCNVILVPHPSSKK